MLKIKKEWKKYLSVLEEIDGKVTNSGINNELDWKIQVAYIAEQKGIPAELIREYIDGDLVIINGEAYNTDGKKIKIA